MNFGLFIATVGASALLFELVDRVCLHGLSSLPLIFPSESSKDFALIAEATRKGRSLKAEDGEENETSRRSDDQSPGESRFATNAKSLSRFAKSQMPPSEVAYHPYIVNVPENVTSGYNPECDTHTSEFKFHNRELLKAQVHMFILASGTGVLKFIWYMCKIILAIVLVPKFPLRDAEFWGKTDFGEAAKKWGDASLDELPYNGRHDPDDLLSYIHLGEMLPTVKDFNKSKVEKFVIMKLNSPEKRLGLNLPWSVQTQAAIFCGQVLQGFFESLRTLVFGPPSIWMFYSSWDWFLLSFRLELSLTMAYVLMRIDIIFFQCSTFFNGKSWDSADFRSRWKRLTVMWYHPVMKCTLRVMILAQGFLVVAATPFLLTLLPVYFVLGAIGEKLQKEVRDCNFQWVSSEVVTPRMVQCFLGPLVLYAFSKSLYFLTEDTYLCPFSKLDLFYADTSYRHVSSVGGYLLVTFALFVSVMCLSSVTGMAKLRGGLFSERTIYFLWLFRSQKTLEKLAESENKDFNLAMAMANYMLPTGSDDGKPLLAAKDVSSASLAP